MTAFTSSIHILHSYAIRINGVIAIALNLLLLGLIHTNKRNDLGAYKHLMSIFVGVNLSCAVVGMLLVPILYVQDFEVVFLSSSPVPSESIRYALLIAYISLVDTSLITMFNHFFYRYIHIAKPNLKYIYERPKYITLMVVISLVSFLFYTYASVLAMTVSESEREFLSRKILDYYGYNATGRQMLAIQYVNSHNTVSWEMLWGSVIIGVVSFVTITAIAYFVVQTRKALSQFDSINLSEKVKKLQRQLFRVLSIQFLVPVMFMYNNIAIFSILPTFQINVGQWGLLSTLCLSLNPTFDPLVIMYFVSDYRNMIIHFFHCSTIHPSSPNPAPLRPASPHSSHMTVHRLRSSNYETE